MGYRLEIVQRLMESFDISAALLARFSEFDPITLTVQTTFGDVNKQLDVVWSRQFSDLLSPRSFITHPPKSCQVLT